MRDDLRRSWLSVAATLGAGVEHGATRRSLEAFDRAVVRALDDAGLDWRRARRALAGLHKGDEPLRRPLAARQRMLGLAWRVATGAVEGATPEEAGHVVAAMAGARSSHAFAGAAWPAPRERVAEVGHLALAPSNGGRTWVAVPGSLALAQVPGREAPVAMRLARPAGGWIDLRVHMGRALRPVLAPGGWDPCPSSLLSALAPDPPAWADNPFAPAVQADARGVRGTPLLPMVEAVRVRSRTGANGSPPPPWLVDVDGVVHRECPFPTLDVAFVSRWGGTAMRPGWRLGAGLDSESAQDTLGLRPRRVEWVGDDAAGMVPAMPAAAVGSFTSLAAAVAASAPPGHRTVARADWEAATAAALRHDLLPEAGDPLANHVSGVTIPAIRGAAGGTPSSDAALAALGLALAQATPRASGAWFLAHGACVAGDAAARKAAEDAEFAATFRFA